MDELLRTSEAARLLRCSALTLKNWEKRGLITPIRIGNRRSVHTGEIVGERRYSREQIEALLKN